MHIGLATWQNEKPSGLFKCEKDVRVLDVLVLFCLAAFLLVQIRVNTKNDYGKDRITTYR